jgi:hypothetical protein
MWLRPRYCAIAPYRRVCQTLEVHVFPGVQHGYMMRGSRTAFDQKMADFSRPRLALLDGLR